MLNKTHSKILKNISFYTKIYPSAILENTSLTNVVVAFILNLWNSFFLEHVRLLPLVYGPCYCLPIFRKLNRSKAYR